MKLRIRGDSVRLRLTQGEVERIARGEPVSECTHFADAVFVYTLDVEPAASNTGARFSNGELRITLGGAEAVAWATDQTRVGIETKIQALAVLIEKDFACLKPRNENEDRDAFPNPNAR